jgi:hypothetical protein
MPDLNGLDPIVVAALIDDDDDDESKELTRQVLEQHAAADEADDDDEDTDDDDTDKDVADEDDPDADKDDIDDKSEPTAPKPPEAIDAPSDDEQKAESERLSRKERRAAKRQEYFESLVLPKQDDTQRIAPQAPAYKPLDITEDSEYDTADLIKDREEYAKSRADYVAAVTADNVRRVADEEKFWTDVEYKAKALYAKPEYAFLDAENEEAFDEKKADHINELYKKVIGFTETPFVNKDGYAKLGPDGQPVKVISTARKDLSYDDFVIGYMENVMNFVDDDEAEKTKNIVKQAAHQGVRPGGSSRRGIGKLRQGDISAMSDEDFEKNEAEIDRQIAAELGM